MEDEGGRSGFTDILEDGKMRKFSNRDDELVWNPKTKKYYRHGSCWEESHSVPRADLIEGPGRTRRQDHGRENPERIAPVAHAADFPRRAPQRKPILSSRDGAAATSCRV